MPPGISPETTPYMIIVVAMAIAQSATHQRRLCHLL
jgi:hypothetical protein